MMLLQKPYDMEINEYRNWITRVMEIFSRVFHRYDSVFFLFEIIEEIIEEKISYSKNFIISLIDIIKKLEKKSYKDFKRADYKRAWLRLLKDFNARTKSIFDSGNILNIKELLKEDTVIQTDGLQGLDLQFFLLWLLLHITSIREKEGFSEVLRNIIVWDEAQNDLKSDISVVSEIIPALRQLGIMLVTISQNPGILDPIILSNTNLLIGTGPLTGKDLWVYQNEMG